MGIDFVKKMVQEFKSGDPISVLTVEPVGRLLDYKAPQDGCSLGAYLEVPLRQRNVLGVVWGAGTSSFDAQKLRPTYRVLDLPVMPSEMRLFLERVAAYTLTPLSAMLRLATRVQDLGKAPEMLKLYHLGEYETLPMTAARLRVLEALKDYEGRAGVFLGELARKADVSAGVVKGLVKHGALIESKSPRDRPYPRLDPEKSPAALSPDQARAAKAICTALEGGEYGTFLLKGVTGSGKTEVYIEAINTCLRMGRMALVLMPEIGLTGAFLERIEARFGARPAQWHSGVTQAERRRCWKMVAHGKAQLVVGARSALYLPFDKLGLIVVDEEHDSSYKQEEGVLYNARDMAVLRGSLAKAQVVLASATPSLESWSNAQSGKYKRLDLPTRFNAVPLPRLEAIDMRIEALAHGRWISSKLEDKIKDRLLKGEQSLLFLNRRGYAPATICRACRHQIGCHQCDARLVEHRALRRLLCHQCGESVPLADTCPACKTKGQLAAIGPGVERLGEEAKALFPEAQIAVLSSDLFTTAREMKTQIVALAQGTGDIIIGTQLVSKGHNFPKLTLVGVIDADLGLQGADLRAAEHSFQAIHQVCGRAGRVDRPGLGLIQTWQPEHPVIKAILSNDMEGFWEVEAEARKLAKVPPFGLFAGIIISSNNLAEGEKFATNMARKCDPLRQIGATLYGPAPAPMACIRGRYRLRFLIKAARGAAVQNAIQAWLSQFRPRGSLRISVDIDPQSFF